jgi:hypothetical protein
VIRTQRREQDGLRSNRDLVPGLTRPHDPVRKVCNFSDHATFDSDRIEVHRGGSTTLIARSAAMGIRVAGIHPGRGRTLASSEQSSSRPVVTGFAL